MVESGNVHRPNSDSLILTASGDHQQAGRPRARRKIHREGGFRIKTKGRTSGTASRLRKDSPMPTRSERLQILRSLSLSALPFKESEQQQQQQQQEQQRHSSSSDMSELSSGEVPAVLPWITGGAGDLGLSLSSRPGSGRTTDSGSTLVEKGQDSPSSAAAHGRRGGDPVVPGEESLFQRTCRTLGCQDSDRGGGGGVGGGAVGGVGISGDFVVRDRRHRQQHPSVNGAGGIHHLFHTDSDSVNSGWQEFFLCFFVVFLPISVVFA